MSPDTTAATRNALSDVVTQAGLLIDESFADPSLASVGGPLLTMDVAGAPDGGLDLCVAVKDTMSEGDDALLRSISEAVAGPGAAVPGQPVAAAGDLLDRFDRPHGIVAITDGEEVRALVISAVERRDPVTGGDDEGDGPTPAAAGATAAPGRADSPLDDPIISAVGGFDKLVNVALDVSVELGRTTVTLSEVLDFDVGSVVELDRPAGAPVDVRVNGMLLAQGEVVLVDDEYAVRITAIVDPRTER